MPLFGILLLYSVQLHVSKKQTWTLPDPTLVDIKIQNIAATDSYLCVIFIHSIFHYLTRLYIGDLQKILFYMLLLMFVVMKIVTYFGL
jgi:hypothetical protein